MCGWSWSPPRAPLPDLRQVWQEEHRAYWQMVISVHYVLLTLTPRERLVMLLRFWGGLTLVEAGLSMEVSRERIRQIEAKALRKLRHPSRSKRLKSFAPTPSADRIYLDLRDAAYRYLRLGGASLLDLLEEVPDADVWHVDMAVDIGLLLYTTTGMIMPRRRR